MDLHYTSASLLSSFLGGAIAVFLGRWSVGVPGPLGQWGSFQGGMDVRDLSVASFVLAARQRRDLPPALTGESEWSFGRRPL